jgi:DNA-binding transcriptional regulator YdaS (Cro superfamily)
MNATNFQPEPEEGPIDEAIRRAGGPTALARQLRERGHDISETSGHATVNQWRVTGSVPADYCPDIEAITGVVCERLRPKTNWAVLRTSDAAPPNQQAGARPA